MCPDRATRRNEDAISGANERVTKYDAAPRMDVVGMRALARGTGAAGLDAPQPSAGLYSATLAGDLICNSAYYSLATTYTRGAALGLLAGIGALVLPPRLGLGTPPGSELLSNQVMSVAWYVIGGSPPRAPLSGSPNAAMTDHR